MGRVSDVAEGTWTPLPQEISQRLGAILQGTSFLEIHLKGHDPGTILVREEGMAKKPSLLLSLTPEEIL